MILGCVAAICNGATAPIYFIIFGKMINSFSRTGDELVSKAGMYAMYVVISYLVILLLLHAAQ